MAITHTVKHPFVSLKPDGADATVVQPSDWNADHDIVFTCSEGVILGRDPAVAAGPVQELTLGSAFTVAGGEINVANQVPVGIIMDYGGSAAPTGWLLCDGSAKLRSTYAALFAVIGTSFGAGDGSTTFNVPDLRGRATFGRDAMGGSAANRVTSGGSGIAGNTLGASGGTETHTLTEAEVPAHEHELSSAGAHYHQLINDAITTGAAELLDTETIAREATTYSLDGVSTGSATLGRSSTAGGHTHTISASGGGGGDHQNMPPAMIVTKIIYASV